MPETICATAREEQADLIVMCSHEEPGLKRWFFGGVAHEVAHQSPTPVLVMNERGRLVSATHGAHLA